MKKVSLALFFALAGISLQYSSLFAMEGAEKSIEMTSLSHALPDCEESYSYEKYIPILFSKDRTIRYYNTLYKTQAGVFDFFLTEEYDLSSVIKTIKATYSDLKLAAYKFKKAKNMMRARKTGVAHLGVEFLDYLELLKAYGHLLESIEKAKRYYSFCK